MPPPVPEQLSRAIETLYRSESGRVLATPVRLLGNLDLAEEAMHDGFAAALKSWPQRAFRTSRSAADFNRTLQGHDVMRRHARFDGAQRELVAHIESRVNNAPCKNGFAS